MKKKIAGFNNYSISMDGVVYNDKFSKPLKAHKNTSGYMKVWIYANKKRHEKFIHKLLLECFVEKIDPSYTQGNHINGIKDDNRLENLEWCNNSLNQIHAYKTGLNFPRGSKIDKIQSETISICFRDGVKAKDLAKYFNISPQNVYSHV